MLYLSPPFFNIKGVVVGRDYSDPTQYWYYPNRPHIAKDEQDRPAVRFLIYKEILENLDATDDEVAAGFLIFDTSLEWDETLLKEVARQIKDEQDLPDTPRLSPLMYRSGKVRMTFLDRKSALPGDPPPGEDTPDSEWVSFIESSGMPSLYGENRAIFSVELTAKGARFVLGSFDGFIPAGVVYELDYVAMQRAYSVKVEADWHFVYNYIRDYEQDRFFFWNDEVEKITEKLVEDKVIKITASIEGIGEEGMAGEYAEVRKQLTQFIYEKFFEPKINPKALLDKDTAGDIVGLLSGLRDGGLPMQWGGSKRELSVEQTRSFEADFTAYRAVERKIAPQAHLSMFWEDLNVARDQVITVVDDRDALWRIVELQLIPVARFAEDAIQHIVVEIVYGELIDDEAADDARVFTVLLDAAKPIGSIRDWYDPAVGVGFHYRYTVAFGIKAAVGDAVLLTSDWKRSNGGDVTINPAELYEERSHLFQRSQLLNTDMFPEVLVRLRYTDPLTGWTYDRAAMLDASHTSWAADFRVRKGAPPGAEFEAQFPRLGGTIATEWAPAGNLIMLDDPRENIARIKLMVTDRADFEQAIVSLEHHEPAHGIFEAETIIIPKDRVNDDHGWQFARSPGSPARYRANYVLLKSTGAVLDTGWVETDSPVLMIGDMFARKWEVRPELIGPSLSASGIEKVTVEMRYDDDENDYHVEKKIVFSAVGQGEAMVLNLRNPSLRDYSYTVAYAMTNGFERKVGPLGGSVSFPIVSSVPPQ
jgi:hypothetical protein